MQNAQRTIDFKEENYEWLKELASTGIWNPKHTDDYLGSIRQGAVCCDFIVMEDEEFENEDFCFGGKFAIDAKYYLLGRDAGYSEVKGVPYDCVSGFYGRLKDTYEETVEDLVGMFDACLAECDILVEGLKNTELTWEKVEAYEGDIYPGYKIA